MSGGASDRVDALDALRGAALLGILVINLPGYAWPQAAAFLGPALPGAGAIDAVAWTANFILFEGKMRGLFALLFGASMALMLDRAAMRGDDGARWQRRRLGWLALFGILHYALLWFGDILFSYAMLGLVLLAMRGWRPGTQVALAIALILCGLAVHAASFAQLGGIEAEAMAPDAGAAARQAWADWRASLGLGENWARDVATMRAGWASAVAWRIGYWQDLAMGPFFGLLDVLPMMLLGMAAVRSDWLEGGARCRRLALIAVPVGLAAFAALAVWLWVGDHRLSRMIMAVLAWSTVPRAVLTVGYAAVGLLAFRAFADHALVRRLRAAGRMALTNYLGMSLVMVPLFAIAGGRLYAAVPPAGLWLAILAGWALMLGASTWWLARHPQGPAERVWRALSRDRRPGPVS